jgi:hypothetical protein
MTKSIELYGKPTGQPYPWLDIVSGQQCPLLNRKCLKNRSWATRVRRIWTR